MLFQKLPSRPDFVWTDRRPAMGAQLQGLNYPSRVSSIFFGRHARSNPVRRRLSVAARYPTLPHCQLCVWMPTLGVKSLARLVLTLVVLRKPGNSRIRVGIAPVCAV